MAIAPFLAMTAAEIYAASALPPKIAWMACHFSPYGLGLSNLPRELPPGSLLMVDDMTPPHGHDPHLIAQQLSERVEALQCRGVLLDFQRPDCEETQSIAEHLSAALPCPVIVSEAYGRSLCCPVFLPPLAPSMPLEDYILPWKDRKVWLEFSMEAETITLTEKGAETALLPCPDLQAVGFQEERLQCHYSIRTDEKSARFTLWRTQDDWEQLLEEAAKSGIVGTVGLYQEFHSFPPDQSLPLEGKVAR